MRKVSAKEKFKNLIQKPLDAIKALVVSFDPNDIGITYTVDAIKRIISITKGYPFFIQQMCQVLYQNTNEKEITLTHVENNMKEFLNRLDIGFFKVRYERCADNDKKFLFAMVECKELPCTISNIAGNLHKSVNSISTTRAQLISKGIVYPIRYKELDFTVPEFDGYIKRLEEYDQWLKDSCLNFSDYSIEN